MEFLRCALRADRIFLVSTGFRKILMEYYEVLPQVSRFVLYSLLSVSVSKQIKITRLVFAENLPMFFFPKLTISLCLLPSKKRQQFPFRGVSDCEDPSAFEWNDDSGARASAAARRLVTALLAREAGQRLRSVRQLERSAFFHHFDFDRLRAKQVSDTLCPPPSSLSKKKERKRKLLGTIWLKLSSIYGFDPF